MCEFPHETRGKTLRINVDSFGSSAMQNSGKLSKSMKTTTAEASRPALPSAGCSRTNDNVDLTCSFLGAGPVLPRGRHRDFKELPAKAGSLEIGPSCDREFR